MAVQTREPVPQAIGQRIICHCARVTQRQIEHSIEARGASTLEEVMQQTGAGQACMGCHYRIRRMLAGLPPECSSFAFCEPLSAATGCDCEV